MPLNDGMKKFVTSKLSTMGGVQHLEWITPNILRITRSEFPEFDTAIIAEKTVTGAHVLESADEAEPSFFANIPSDAVWTGEAIRVVEAMGAGWGRFGNLMSVIGRQDVKGFVDQEVRFATRMIKQHTNVMQLTPIFDKLYDVTFRSGSVKRVIFINDYDLTADAVRSARERYGSFDHVLKTNPNGRITESAVSAAESLGAKVLDASDYMRELKHL
ncbi:hypothetical protein AB4Y96_09120 [Phyllobacterium sp. TAF24]|uniref:hypothetical protein n=1 Tax=Phyllobacterium sp. TAF24 TaxID=3233068 RepID=UPI003F9C3FDF